MKTKWKRRCLIAVAFVCSVVALVAYVRMTWITKDTRQVIVRMPTCTSSWQACQQIALVHLSDAIDQYPASNQYQVRWSSQWFPLDDTSYFEVAYNRKDQSLTEGNIGQASMDFCSRVTDNSIHKSAKIGGGFETLAKYGANHLSL